MTVSFVGSQGAAAATVTIPAHQVGDLILIFAYRDGSNTAPTIPTAGGTVPTWTTIGSTGANTNSSAFVRTTATATNHTSGTFTNATELICLVYRGATVGASAGGSGSATTSIAYPALTLQRTNNTSWVVGVAGHRTATNVELAPTGMTNRTSIGTEAAGHDTNGTVSSWTQQTVTVNASSAYRSWTVELRDKTIVLTAGQGTHTFTGINATLSKGFKFVADKGTFTESGVAASLLCSRLVTGVKGTFTETGIPAGVLRSRLITGTAGAYVLDGKAASFSYVPVTGYTLPAVVGAFSLGLPAASLRKSRLLASATGPFTLVGKDASTLRSRRLPGAPGGLSAAFSAAGLVYWAPQQYILGASPAVYTFVGLPGQLLYSDGAQIRILSDGEVLWVGAIGSRTEVPWWEGDYRTFDPRLVLRDFLGRTYG